MDLLLRQQKGLVADERQLLRPTEELAFPVEEADERDRERSSAGLRCPILAVFALDAGVLTFDPTDQTKETFADVDIAADRNVAQDVAVVEQLGQVLVGID